MNTIEYNPSRFVTPNDFSHCLTLKEERQSAWKANHFGQFLAIWLITLIAFVRNSDCFFASSPVYDDRVRDFKRRIRCYGKTAAKRIASDHPEYDGALKRALWELWFEGFIVPGDTPLKYPLAPDVFNFLQLGFDLGWHKRLTQPEVS